MALEAARDLRDARSLVSGMTDSLEVASLLPGHAAYLRVFNPAHDSAGRPVTWRSLVGGAMHPALQWDGLQRINRQPRNLQEPEMGTLDPRVAAELVRLLKPRTKTPDRCVFLVWEGYAGLRETVVSAPTITIGFEQRTMHALQGTVDDATETVEDDGSSRLPLWWLPADHAWSVGNDLYGRSVYIGGGEDTIRALLASPTLEALPVAPDQLVGQEDL